MFKSPTAIKIYILIGVVTIVLLTGRFLYNKHTGLVEDLANAKQANQELVEKVEKREEQIETMKKDVKRQQETIGDLIETEREQFNRIQMLEGKLTKNGRDIGVLVRKKPELMEKIIDRGAKFRMRCLEIASGSPVTEDDRNANNTVCPQLIDPDSQS